MSLGVWIGLVLLAANAAVVVLGVRYAQKTSALRPPPGSPRRRYGSGR